MGNYGKQMFDKLDKVATMAIGKYLTIHNDYLALLLTCKRLFYFLHKMKTTPLIALQYYTWSRKATKTTVFLDTYRERVKKDSSMIVRWRGKYTRGWYEITGTWRRIEIIDSPCLEIFTEAVEYVGYDPDPYQVCIYSPEDKDINQYIDLEHNMVSCDNGCVLFSNNSFLKEFIQEIEYIHRLKKEAELRWDYQEEKEIRL